MIAILNCNITSNFLARVLGFQGSVRRLASRREEASSYHSIRLERRRVSAKMTCGAAIRGLNLLKGRRPRAACSERQEFRGLPKAFALFARFPRGSFSIPAASKTARLARRTKNRIFNRFSLLQVRAKFPRYETRPALPAEHDARAPAAPPPRGMRKEKHNAFPSFLVF